MLESRSRRRSEDKWLYSSGPQVGVGESYKLLNLLKPLVQRIQLASQIIELRLFSLEASSQFKLLYTILLFTLTPCFELRGEFLLRHIDLAPLLRIEWPRLRFEFLDLR